MQTDKSGIYFHHRTVDHSGFESGDVQPSLFIGVCILPPDSNAGLEIGAPRSSHQSVFFVFFVCLVI